MDTNTTKTTNKPSEKNNSVLGVFSVITVVDK